MNIEFGKLYLEWGKTQLGLEKLKKGYDIISNKIDKTKYARGKYYLYLGDYYHKQAKYKSAVKHYHLSIISQLNNFNDSNIYTNPDFEQIRVLFCGDFLGSVSFFIHLSVASGRYF